MQLTAQGRARGCANPSTINRAVSYVTLIGHVMELLGGWCSPAAPLALEYLFQTIRPRWVGHQYVRK